MSAIPRKVCAAITSATYSVGVFCTETDEEAIESARERYADSPLGRALKDVGAFRFYVAGRGKDAYK